MFANESSYPCIDKDESYICGNQTEYISHLSSKVSGKTPDCRECRRESKCEILRVAFHAKRWRSYAVDIFRTGNQMKEMLQNMTMTLLDNFPDEDNMGSIQTKIIALFGNFSQHMGEGLLNLLMSIYQVIFGKPKYFSGAKHILLHKGSPKVHLI